MDITGVELADRRWLGFREHGDPDGRPVLYCHGLPGGGVLALEPAAMATHRVRLITVERPGFGSSDPHPGRLLLDVADDIEQLGDTLGLDRFAVLGASAGAPNALACAHRLGDRVSTVGIVSGVGPLFDHPEFDTILPDQQQLLLPIARQDIDGALALVREVTTPVVEAWADDPAAAFEAWVQESPEVDRAALRRDREMWMEVLDATYGNGADTFVDEVRATFGPWGFELAGVGRPVHMWHGDADDMAPLTVARHVAGQLPDARLTVYPGEGHVLDERHHGDWLGPLTADL